MREPTQEENARFNEIAKRSDSPWKWYVLEEDDEGTPIWAHAKTGMGDTNIVVTEEHGTECFYDAYSNEDALI